MTDEMLSKLVSEQLDSVLERNHDVISRELSSCVDDGDYVDPVAARMVAKAIRLSSHISVQLIIKILEEVGVMHLPPDGTPILYPLDEA